MKHSLVQIKTLTTIEQCLEAIDLIENDYRNTNCTLDQWCNGSKNCYLNKGAVNTVHKLHNKMERIEMENIDTDKIKRIVAKHNSIDHLLHAIECIGNEDLPYDVDNMTPFNVALIKAMESKIDTLQAEIDTVNYPITPALFIKEEHPITKDIKEQVTGYYNTVEQLISATHDMEETLLGHDENYNCYFDAMIINAIEFKIAKIHDLVVMHQHAKQAGNNDTLSISDISKLHLKVMHYQKTIATISNNK